MVFDRLTGQIRWGVGGPALAAALAAVACQPGHIPSRGPERHSLMGESERSAASAGEAERFRTAREEMVERQLRGRDITAPLVLEAMSRVPRHRFVPHEHVEQAYHDRPLPINYGQTISQPYIVALMTQLAAPTAESRALDVGTGSGYQAAVLAEICGEVYGIEIVEPLAERSAAVLDELGYENVTVRAGDGYRGWPEHAPFDVIILAAAPDHVPQPLIDQLAPGGRLVLPVGRRFQKLLVVEKQEDGSITERSVAGVAFVPMTGEAESREERADP